MQKRKLGASGPDVGAIDLGRMGMSAFHERYPTGALAPLDSERKE